MTINERITEIRTAAGLSKVAFARALNISDSMVNLSESGKRELTNRTAADICEKSLIIKSYRCILIFPRRSAPPLRNLLPRT